VKGSMEPAEQVDLRRIAFSRDADRSSRSPKRSAGAAAIVLSDADVAWIDRAFPVASTAGKWGSLFQSAYNASKHGVMGLTRSLALEVVAQGVRVNAVCPGYVETPLLDKGVEEWRFSASLGVAAQGV
jgi:short chain dehydrogenase